VSGITYNLRNANTDYQSGVDWHLDWGASQFLSKQIHIGAVGYFYQQITGDSGAPAALGEPKSRVMGVGPQIGYIFRIGDMHGYLNLKGYYEFETYYRPRGWNIWLTISVSGWNSIQFERFRFVRPDNRRLVTVRKIEARPVAKPDQARGLRPRLA
jgi:hypothetical protein